MHVLTLRAACPTIVGATKGQRWQHLARDRVSVRTQLRYEEREVVLDTIGIDDAVVELVAKKG